MNGQTLTKAMVPLPGKAFAIYNNSSGPLYYAHPDLLGSIRLATTPARAKYFDTAYAPFGETYASSGTLDAAYTGQMGDLSHRQDTAGGLYDFPAREYSTQGRWPSPDPAGVAATCTKDPQSQNRYAYVRNNPITRVDPNGMIDCGPDDPFCGDPCFWDPFFCDPFPGGGGGFIGGGGGERPRPFPWPTLPLFFFGESGQDDCHCEKKPTLTEKFWCYLNTAIFGCHENNGSENCQETISNQRQPMQGDECGNRNPPGTMVESWSCAGNVPCCEKKATAWRAKCQQTQGQFYAISPPIFGSFYSMQCCKRP
jgi:RHS repeat-associated protein